MKPIFPLLSLTVLSLASPAQAEVQPAVYAVSIYAAGKHENCSFSQGPVTVSLPSSDRPVVLILSSLYPAIWKLENSENANLVRILATSGHWTRVSNAPKGVPVVLQSPYDIAVDNEGKPLAKVPSGMQNFDAGWAYDLNDPNQFYGDYCLDKLPKDRRVPIPGIERPGRSLGQGLMDALAPSIAPATMRALGGGEPLILAQGDTGNAIDLADPRWQLKSPAQSAVADTGWCSFPAKRQNVHSSTPDWLRSRAIPFGHSWLVEVGYDSRAMATIVAQNPGDANCTCKANVAGQDRDYFNEKTGICAKTQAEAAAKTLATSVDQTVPGYAAVPAVFTQLVKPDLTREQFVALALKPLRNAAADRKTLDRAQLLVTEAEKRAEQRAQSGNRMRQQTLAYDADGDGSVTRAEAEQRLLPQFDRLAKLMQQDADFDGVISEAELKDPAPAPYDKPYEVASEQLAALLALGSDGHLTAERLLEIANGAFDAIDLDRDTLLSDKEVAALMAQVKR